ncbi:hypothetical protein GCM10009664_52640 [Kitasatospora gansuensis]
MAKGAVRTPVRTAPFATLKAPLPPAGLRANRAGPKADMTLSQDALSVGLVSALPLRVTVSVVRSMMDQSPSA